MNEWRPIETAPKDGTAIWLLVDGRPFIGYGESANWMRKADRWVIKATYDRSSEDERQRDIPDRVYLTVLSGTSPTLWQPLPAAPTPRPGEEER